MRGANNMHVGMNLLDGLGFMARPTPPAPAPAPHPSMPNANSAPLTLDVHAAFAHHFHNHRNNAKHGGGGGGDAAMPTMSGTGASGASHLSPNAYFLQELDEQHAMDLDHGAHSGYPRPMSSSYTSSSNANNAYDGSSTTKDHQNTTSASASKSASASHRVLPRNKDDFDFDLDAAIAPTRTSSSSARLVREGSALLDLRGGGAAA
ncbi:hypothetical protein B0H10DRAFT_1328674 [Mycena sp. CBHHK59/15]|nr:hypothetical protein B0H10DRAFT_1328674 [Mycena sp. CBHHK59/15]